MNIPVVGKYRVFIMTLAFTWKYAMILREIKESGEEICEMVNLYDFSSGAPTFYKASLVSPCDLEAAYRDIKRDGVNRWFYENGKFSWEKDCITEEYFWSWSPNVESKPIDSAIQTCTREYEDEIELYKTYGGD